METGTPDLRRGWTTGACATAATKAAYLGLMTGLVPESVAIDLPQGCQPRFAIAEQGIEPGRVSAAVVKDAGDDPDVTHGALIRATVEPGLSGSGVTFAAGPGVGMVTLPGLPVPVGEPAINPVPRRLMTDAICTAAAESGWSRDVRVTISIPGGDEMARRTWNPRLGIVGGLSILGTTGVVVPYSCSAWIDSIHRGIDVARSIGTPHVAGCTGSTSEATVQKLYGLPDTAMLDMGDFAGGLLKYLRKHPVPRLTVGGGFGKITKLAQGAMDLHSKRSQVDVGDLADRLTGLGVGADKVAAARSARSAAQVLGMVEGTALADNVAAAALDRILAVLDTAPVSADVVIVDRAGAIVGRAGPLPCGS